MSGGYVPTMDNIARIQHPDSAKTAVDPFLKYLLDAGGSDLHLIVNYRPRISLHGSVVDIEGYQYEIDADYVNSLALHLFNGDEKRLTKFRQIGDANFAYEYTPELRFRVNMCMERGNISFTFRTIPADILPFEKLGLPQHLEEITKMPNGLVLICGPTGSGKSTTLASVIDLYNRFHEVKIVTLENPIEFYHKPKKATIIQREVSDDGNGDALNFSVGIRNALRQKPNIILVGEMTGPEEVMAAVKAAETGHLVLATLHTTSVKDTVDRIISDTPIENQNKIRGSLAESLRLIMCQTLCKKANGKGQVIAYENMYIEANARNLIRNNQTHELNSYFNSNPNNISLDKHLAQLLNTGQITKEMALFKATSAKSLNQYVDASVVDRGGQGFEFED